MLTTARTSLRLPEPILNRSWTDSDDPWREIRCVKGAKFPRERTCLAAEKQSADHRRSARMPSDKRVAKKRKCSTYCELTSSILWDPLGNNPCLWGLRDRTPMLATFAQRSSGTYRLWGSSRRFPNRPLWLLGGPMSMTTVRVPITLVFIDVVLLWTWRAMSMPVRAAPMVKSQAEKGKESVSRKDWRSKPIGRVCSGKGWCHEDGCIETDLEGPSHNTVRTRKCSAVSRKTLKLPPRVSRKGPWKQRRFDAKIDQFRRIEPPLSSYKPHFTNWNLLGIRLPPIL